jgi:hypothetical protein
MKLEEKISNCTHLKSFRFAEIHSIPVNRGVEALNGNQTLLLILLSEKKHLTNVGDP